ncbi:MAG: GNAT family N-acetyltransferase [Acidimicrobiia bacterium]|nr:GNAT family N-acetyltransferase [Acidimicrobiia bacterium]
MDSIALTIVPSYSRPEAAPHFARLQFDAWGHHYPHSSIEQSTFDLRAEFSPTTDLALLRMAWFALDTDDSPLGVIMLLGGGEVEPNDALELPGPWLAGLIVDPRSRREGVASALINFVTAKAKEMGFERLRLVTEHEVSFYERRGWIREREVTLNSVPNTVMFTTLTP